jgi:hypothetical protein
VREARPGSVQSVEQESYLAQIRRAPLVDR